MHNACHSLSTLVCLFSSSRAETDTLGGDGGGGTAAPSPGKTTIVFAQSDGQVNVFSISLAETIPQKYIGGTYRNSANTSPPGILGPAFMCQIGLLHFRRHPYKAG